MLGKVLNIYLQTTLKTLNQWRIQNLSHAGIPLWAPKLGAQTKGELMQINISHLMISSTQMGLHVLRYLTQVKNVELKTLCMPGSAAQVCLNVSQCIVFISESNISLAPVCRNKKTGFSVECFTADFLRFFTKKTSKFGFWLDGWILS